MSEQTITLEQIAKDIQTLQHSMDLLAETVQSDIKDLSDIRTKVANNNTLITALQTQISHEGQIVRSTVERTIGIHLRPLRYVQVNLQSFLARKPKSIYFIKQTTFWDWLRRRTKFHDEVVKGVSV